MGEYCIELTVAIIETASREANQQAPGVNIYHSCNPVLIFYTK